MRTTSDLIRQAASFEILGLLIATRLTSPGSSTIRWTRSVSLPSSATAATARKSLCNLGFDHLLRRATGALHKTLPIRVAHAVLFEATLLLLLLPPFAWWLGITLREALLMDLSFAAFYALHAFAFIWAYDTIFQPGGAAAMANGEALMEEEEETGGSPACFAHELVEGQPVDPETARDVARFRRAERARLMEARRRMSSSDRARAAETLARAVDQLVTPEAGMRVAVYWPIRGEPDLRGWMTRAHDTGASVLLPVVIRKAEPLVFRLWSPGCAMERGIWNIPVPAEGKEKRPDVVVAPLVGVDRDCYRLGNGGGYYDRTLAGLDPLPRVIGVGFADCRVPTIYPMPWDIPMHSVVLADGTVQHRA